MPNPDNINVSIEIGSVETIDPEENASIVNSGTETNAVFDFKIPRGKDGNTPYIGSNGNWFVGEKDTGFPATAAAGNHNHDGVYLKSLTNEDLFDAVAELGDLAAENNVSSEDLMDAITELADLVAQLLEGE